MATYFETNRQIYILALEKINYSNPFIIVELIKSNGSETLLEFKIRYGSINFNEIEQYYWSLKKITVNPILIYNGYLVDITENRNNVKKAFSDYYANNIKIIQIEEPPSEQEQKELREQTLTQQALIQQVHHDNQMKKLNDLVTQRFCELKKINN